MIANCCTCSTLIFPHSTNQIIDLWRCPYRCRPHFFNSLLSLRVGNLTLSNCMIPNFRVSLSQRRSISVSLENNSEKNLDNTVKWWLWTSDGIEALFICDACPVITRSYVISTKGWREENLTISVVNWRKRHEIQEEAKYCQGNFPVLQSGHLFWKF